jgi:hypothetical protein
MQIEDAGVYVIRAKRMKHGYEPEQPGHPGQPGRPRPHWGKNEYVQAAIFELRRTLPELPSNISRLTELVNERLASDLQYRLGKVSRQTVTRVLRNS